MAITKSAAKRRKKSLKKSLPYTRFILALLLILAGAGLLIRLALSKAPLNLPGQGVKTTVAPADHLQLAVKPTKLYIPRISKVLYISDGYVQGDRWVISQTGVSYLTTSALPGTVGNSVIYGHNLNDILGYLPNVTNGDVIYVVLSSGNFLKYQVIETKVIDPAQVEILNQNTGDSRLTVYTCTGFLDQARFVVVAKLV